MVAAAACGTLRAINQRYNWIALRLGLVVASSLATLLVLDLIYVFGYQVPRTAHSHSDFWFVEGWVPRDSNLPDAELGFVRKPLLHWQGGPATSASVVSYRTDENGFRNEPGIQQADIVFIGDSFTEAASVPEADTFVQRVGSLTNRAVVNLGRGLYGPQQELIVLSRFGLSYNPRVVVWQLFEGNDLFDATRYEEWRRMPASPTFVQRYLWNSLITHWLDLTLPTGAVVRQQVPSGEGGPRDVHLDYAYSPDEPDRLQKGFAETTKAIESGYRLCASRGITLIVVFIPIKVRGLGDTIVFHKEKERDEYFPGGVTQSERDFAHQIANYCDQLKCPFIDVTSELRRKSAEGSRRVYMLGPDTHLDVDGHNVVAEVLAQQVRVSLEPKLKD